MVSTVTDSKVVSNVKDNKVKDATKFTNVEVLDKDKKVTQTIVLQDGNVVITKEGKTETVANASIVVKDTMKKTAPLGMGMHRPDSTRFLSTAGSSHHPLYSQGPPAPCRFPCSSPQTPRKRLVELSVGNANKDPS